MQMKGPDTPNHKDKYSIEFLMLWNHEIDTKFLFLAHLVQKLLLKLFSDRGQYWGGHIGFPAKNWPGCPYRLWSYGVIDIISGGQPFIAGQMQHTPLCPLGNWLNLIVSPIWGIVQTFGYRKSNFQDRKVILGLNWSLGMWEVFYAQVGQWYSQRSAGKVPSLLLFVKRTVYFSVFLGIT